MALTKVSGDFIQDGSITQGHLHASHGITTSDIGEGSNLYFTTARVNTAFGNLSTSDLSEGTNLYYTQARFNTAFAAKSTSDLSEGTNLYYTDARVGSYLTTNSYATQSYVNTQVSNLVDSAPSTLDTLNELAAALGDDANFSTTVTNSIATKMPLAGGTFTGGVTITTSNSPGLKISKDRNTDNRFLRFNDTGTSGKDYDIINNGNLAFYNHTDSNYILQITSSGNATFTGTLSASGYNNSNWDTAYGWGNHASAGYLTSYTETDTLQTVTNRGATTTNAITLSGNSNGLYFTGGNNRIYFSGYRAMEGSTTGSNLQIGEGYSLITIQDLLYVDEDIRSKGQIRATGWYNNASSSVTGHAVEIGVSPPTGTEGYILSYNRDNSTYGDLNFDAINYHFNNRSSGTFEVEGSVRTPIFYDSDNTARYVDPTSLSRLNSLEIANTSNKDTPGALMKIGSDGFIFGGNNSGKETNSAQISAGYHTANSLNFVGMGTTSSVRRMDFWAEGGFHVSGVIYDKDATQFYIDPTGTTNLSKAVFNTAGTGLPRQITIKENGDTENSMGSYPGAWTSALNIQSNDGSTYLWFSPLTSNIPRIQTNYGQLDFYTGNNTNRALHLSGTSARSEVFYDLNNTGYYTNPAGESVIDRLNRAEHHRGHFEGSYNNIGGNSQYTNPIYTIGSSYNPNSTTLGNMYGIGFAHPNLWGSGKTSDWGMYVAANGSFEATIGQGSTTIWAKQNIVSGGGVYANAFYDQGNTGYYVDPASTSILNRVEIDDDLDVRAQTGTWITSNIMGDAIGWNTSYGVYIGSNVGGTHYLRGNGTFTTGGSTYNLWHQGNDGTGSGLDADLVDGYHAAQTYYSSANHPGSYLGGHYSSGGAEKPNSGTFGRGKLKLAMLGSGNLGFGGSWNDVLWMSSYTGGDVKRSTALVSSKYDNTSLWIVKQNYDSSSWGTGYLIPVYGANPGSGSLYAASFIDSNDTGYYADPNGTSSLKLLKTGQNHQVNTPRWDTAFYVAQSQHYYAHSSTQTMYLGESNFINIRNTADIHGDARSPIYYDRANTGYYTRPASSSNMYSIYTSSFVQVGGSGTSNLWLGGQSGNYFRFHTNNSDTYFDANVGNIYWRQGSSTRFYFYMTTANMTINGTLTQYSDIRYKENIVEIPDAIDKIKSIRGVYYNRTDFNTEPTKIGVIAQEVEVLMPELVLQAEDTDMKSVSYNELTAVLVQAIKEQQTIIDDLKSRIETLENQ